MGQAEGAHAPGPADPFRTSPSSPSDDRAHTKARELFDLLVALEAQLADPQSVAHVGQCYGRLSEWTKEHLFDSDLQMVLESLQPDPIYPTWRRQALEEAYRLYYDDAARLGDPEALARLPEPPTSEEIGFRRLPEELVNGAAARAPLYSGAYEDKSACPLGRRRWEYEIRRLEAKDGWAGGREIVAKTSSHKGQAQKACAADYLQQLAMALVPAEQCCARRDEARRARGPFFLPEGPRAPPLRPPGMEQPASRAAAPRPHAAAPKQLGATPRTPRQQNSPGAAEAAAAPARPLMEVAEGAQSWPAPRGLSG